MATCRYQALEEKKVKLQLQLEQQKEDAKRMVSAGCCGCG